MTAKTPAADQPFSVVLDDDDTNVAEGRWHAVDAGPTWAKHRVNIRLEEGDADTSGHAYDPTSIAISLSFDDEVEGHALSLHFPSAEKADEFRKRLLATGVVAGALIVGVTAAQLTATAPASSVSGPAAAPAPVLAPAPAVNPRIPAEDLAPSVPLKAPAVNPRIPAEDLAPSATTSGATTAPATTPQTPEQRHRADHR